MQKMRKRQWVAVVLVCFPWVAAQAGIFGGNSGGSYGYGNGGRQGFPRGWGGPNQSPYGGYGNRPFQPGFNQPFPPGYGQPGYGQPGYGTLDPAMQGYPQQQGFPNPGMQGMPPAMQPPQMPQNVQPAFPPAQPAQPEPVLPIGDLSPEPPLADPPPEDRPATVNAQLTSRKKEAPVPTPLPALENYLRQARSDQPNLRADAALHLGQLRSREAIKPLVHLLREDGSPQVREAAVRGLAIIGAVETLDVIRHAALTDNDRDVRHAASFAAEILQTRKGCGP